MSRTQAHTHTKEVVPKFMIRCELCLYPKHFKNEKVLKQHVAECHNDGNASKEIPPTKRTRQTKLSEEWPCKKPRRQLNFDAKAPTKIPHNAPTTAIEIIEGGVGLEPSSAHSEYAARKREEAARRDSHPAPPVEIFKYANQEFKYGKLIYNDHECDEGPFYVEQQGSVPVRVDVSGCTSGTRIDLAGGGSFSVKVYEY